MYDNQLPNFAGLFPYRYIILPYIIVILYFYTLHIPYFFNTNTKFTHDTKH